MNQEETIATVAIDIGTHRVRTAVVGRSEDGTTRLLAYGCVNTRGLEAGQITDTQRASEVVEASLYQVKQQLGDVGMIRVAIVGIGGMDMQAAPTDSQLQRQKKWSNKSLAVTFDDITKLRNSHHRVFIPNDYQQLELVPTGYSVDYGELTMKPVGLPAQHIQAFYLSIASHRTTIDTIYECCKKASVAIKSLLFSPVTSDRIVLDPQEKKDGVIIVDIGFETTNVLYAKDGLWQIVFPMPIGSNHITMDIATVFELPLEMANRLKKEYGLIAPKMGEDEEGNPVPPEPIVMAGIDKEIDPVLLQDVIAARSEEIIDRAVSSLSTIVNQLLFDPMVLTGGGAMLPGLQDFATNYAKRQVRIGYPNGIFDLAGEAASPAAVNVLGMALYGFEITSVGKHGYLTRLYDWVNGG